jgi:hypothetical protein
MNNNRDLFAGPCHRRARISLAHRKGAARVNASNTTGSNEENEDEPDDWWITVSAVPGELRSFLFPPETGEVGLAGLRIFSKHHFKPDYPN